MKMKQSVRRRRLAAGGTHAVFRLADDLLLIFKPRGHREAVHAHPHRQRLRVLSGQLLVRTGRRVFTLRPDSRLFTLAAGRRHTTSAVQDTWLVAETLAPVARVRGSAFRN